MPRTASTSPYDLRRPRTSMAVALMRSSPVCQWSRTRATARAGERRRLERPAAGEAAPGPVPPLHPGLPEAPAQEGLLSIDPSGEVHQPALGIAQDDPLGAEGFD